MTSGASIGHLPESEIYSNFRPIRSAVTCVYLADSRPAIFLAAIQGCKFSDFSPISENFLENI